MATRRESREYRVMEAAGLAAPSQRWEVCCWHAEDGAWDVVSTHATWLDARRAAAQARIDEARAASAERQYQSGYAYACGYVE